MGTDDSSSMLRAVIESTIDGLLVTARSGKILCYNKLYLDMWPIPLEVLQLGTHQAILQYCSNYIKTPQQFISVATEIYTTWPSESFDVLLLNSGRVFERYSKPKFVERKNVGRVWSFRDVTERKRAEAHTAQLAAIVQSSNDAIVVKDLNGIITNWNAGAERIFGYRESEVMGCSITKLMLPDQLEEEDRIMNLIKSGKFTDHFETVRLAKGNKLVNVSIMVSPVKDAAGDIIGASKVARDITQSKQSQERIEHLAYYDALTGLPNRALLSDRMKIALGQAARRFDRMGVLFVNLDRFRLINDSLGHGIGDKLLRLVGERMQLCIRLTDTISRVGGDEFVILLSQIEGFENAGHVAKKLVAAVSQPFVIEAHELILTASIGISIYPDNGKDASSLLSNANASMYSAKEAGRNRYQFYSEKMTSRASDGLSLERDLRGAIERNEIFTVFQPQIELSSGFVIGAEALMRWQHPKRGLVPPGDFIPIAEDSGVILLLGEHILREACVQAHRWYDSHGTDVGVAVNVSAVQFRQDDFTDVVLRVLASTGLSPKRLELELTESVVMEGVESVGRKIRILESHGIKIAIDDFGTGYSSLSYLRKFTVDRLKIDQSFISDLPGNADAEAIVRAIVAMGRGLGLRVIAEGVETNEQATFLRSVGCDESQGYLYAKPMLAHDFKAWLVAWKAATPAPI